jgi:flavin reductase (DIM6/NTAB) family NADH-FMN oxidoreductase RutF
MEAEVIDRIDLGSHSIFVADVISSEVLKTGRPLTYHYYHEHLKGKSPRNAPTFEPPASKGA